MPFTNIPDNVGSSFPSFFDGIFQVAVRLSVRDGCDRDYPDMSPKTMAAARVEETPNEAFSSMMRACK